MRYLNMFFSFFSSSNFEKRELPWIDLNSMDQLESINTESKEKLMIIFKHSTRRGISRIVLKEFMRQYPLTEDTANLYYLDIFGFRAISNEISSRFGVVHESPQLLVIKDGNVVHHASHHRINSNKLNEFISVGEQK